MSTKVVSTKLTEEEHSKLLDVCNEKGCTPANLIKEAVLEKISFKEPKKDVKDMSYSELAKALGI